MNRILKPLTEETVMYWFPSIVLFPDRLSEMVSGHDAIRYDRPVPVCIPPRPEDTDEEGYW